MTLTAKRQFNRSLRSSNLTRQTAPEYLRSPDYFWFLPFELQITLKVTYPKMKLHHLLMVKNLYSSTNLLVKTYCLRIHCTFSATYSKTKFALHYGNWSTNYSRHLFTSAQFNTSYLFGQLVE